MGFFDNQNPGIGGLDELTTSEELFLQTLNGLSYAQGDILYHNGSGLTRLAAGTSGYFLKTLGAGANPQWGAASVTTRVVTTTSSATPTPDADATDQYQLTAQAASATFGAPTGTPGAGQKMLIRIKDNATAQSLSWNAIYRAVGVTLPTTTTISKTMYVGMVYNLTDVKWDVIAVGEEA